jgi:tetratricopeptide (TPR) repeat protein
MITLPHSKYVFLECRPDGYQSWFEQGNQLRKLNCYREALWCYDKALDYYSHDYYTWYYRGKVLEELNELTDALSSFIQACNIQPDNYWAWYDRGCILQDYLQDYHQSIACFQQVLKYKSRDYWATYRLAKAYFHLKKYLSALNLWQKALDLRPHDYWSYYWQAECQQILQQWQNAESSYLQALQIKPHDYWATYHLALMKEKQCLYPEAIAYYHQLEPMIEENPDIYRHLSTCYRILGNEEQANYYQTKINPKLETVS